MQAGKNVAENVPRFGFMVIPAPHEKRFGTLKIAIRFAPRFIVLSSVPVKSRFRPFFGVNVHDPVRVMCLPGLNLFAISTSPPYA